MPELSLVVQHTGRKASFQIPTCTDGMGQCGLHSLSTFRTDLLPRCAINIQTTLACTYFLGLDDITATVHDPVRTYCAASGAVPMRFPWTCLTPDHSVFQCCSKHATTKYRDATPGLA